MFDPKNLLAALATARWNVAFRIYGNSHATLIGLLVDWWISGDPRARWALEGGPSFANLPRGVGGGQCDAILGAGEASLGVVEVEGTRLTSTLEKIGRFFASGLPDLKDLRFGIFLAYGYGPAGVGAAREIPALKREELRDLACEITRQTPGRALAVLALDKRWERHRAGPRARNEYYGGTPVRLHGALVLDGSVLEERDLTPADR